MSRLARIVIPSIPHHVTQRGNRRQQVFYSDHDYRDYMNLLSEHAKSAGVAVWAWCLMPNHVHLMMVPPDENALRSALAETHRRYSRLVNFREGWRGYLWQGRFASCPMDQAHAMAAARYIELNPVRARLAQTPQDWPWSSARAHLSGQADGLTDIAALGREVDDWAGFLNAGLSDEAAQAIRRGERTGRPLGDKEFIARLEAVSGRVLAPKKAGRKPKRQEDGVQDRQGDLL